MAEEGQATRLWRQGWGRMESTPEHVIARVLYETLRKDTQTRYSPVATNRFI